MVLVCNNANNAFYWILKRAIEREKQIATTAAAKKVEIIGAFGNNENGARN